MKWWEGDDDASAAALVRSSAGDVDVRMGFEDTGTGGVDTNDEGRGGLISAPQMGGDGKGAGRGTSAGGDGVGAQTLITRWMICKTDESSTRE